jgi:hypothetical protein
MPAESLSDDSRYRLLIEAVTEYAIYMLDPTRIVPSWNPGAQRFKGYASSGIIGQHFSRFYTEEDQNQGMPALALGNALRTRHQQRCNPCLNLYTRPEPSLLPIERPRCPKCQGRMMLARIEPSPDGSDLRTFECPKVRACPEIAGQGPVAVGQHRLDGGWA